MQWPRSAEATQGGFSLLELVVVIVLIGVLIAVALDRLLPWIDEAERVAVMRLEGELRSALMLEAARHIARGDRAGLEQLHGANPMALLLERPRNYLGEYSATEGMHVPDRYWFFDRERRELVYQPSGPKVSEALRLALRAEVAYADRNGSGAFEPASDEFHGVRLIRADRAF